MKRQLKGVLFDAKKREVRVIEIEDELKKFYEIIDCRCIDIVSRKIGDKYYDIICDDEGAMIENPKISAINDKGRVMLVGNLFIVNGPDSDGNLTSIDESDYENIKNNVCIALDSNLNTIPVVHIEY